MRKLIEFRNIVKSFDGQVVLKGVNLNIYENEFVTLLGPSGCGKTTLLRILGGFLEQDEGTVIFDGQCIDGVPPYKREINTVFQRYALFPHMNVFENIAFGLRIKKTSKEEIYARLAGETKGAKLEIAANDPMLVRKRFVYDDNNVPVEYNIGYYRADSFTYTIESTL